MSQYLEEQLAKQWMRGTRQGSNRPSWAHPEDLVKLLSERPGEFSEAGQKIAIKTAWLHDIIEDGVKEDGSKVTRECLLKENVPIRVVELVEQLTHLEGEPKEKYLKRLIDVEYLAKLVKCVDRICNLREGSLSFTDERWMRYVRETHKYIIPLTQYLRDDTALWLKTHLYSGIEMRQF